MSINVLPNEIILHILLKNNFIVSVLRKASTRFKDICDSNVDKIFPDQYKCYLKITQNNPELNIGSFYEARDVVFELELLSTNKQKNNNDFFIEAGVYNSCKLIKFLLFRGGINKKDIKKCMLEASKNNNTDILKYLLSFFAIGKTIANILLRIGSKNRNTEIINIAIQHGANDFIEALKLVSIFPDHNLAFSSLNFTAREVSTLLQKHMSDYMTSLKVAIIQNSK